MILVTGATGNIGREVVRELHGRGATVRAAVVDGVNASRVPDGVETVTFDFADAATYGAALAGVERVFLMRPPQITDMAHTLNPFVDAALAAGVRHVVFVSLLGVQNNPRVPHYAAEQHLKTLGVPYTFLRPSFFMQNLGTTHRREIQERDEIYLPVGKARTSFIDTRDIGAVAASVLTETGHDGQAYSLTGGEALDYYQVADIFTEVLGRRITYKDPSSLAFLYSTVRHGTPLKFALVMSMLYRSTKQGIANVVTDDVPRLLGRPPRTFRQYVIDYADSWKR
ncbi:MAG: SDR family oxidoreductase [Caldilineales bacterium]